MSHSAENLFFEFFQLVFFPSLLKKYFFQGSGTNIFSRQNLNVAAYILRVVQSTSDSGFEIVFRIFNLLADFFNLEFLCEFFFDRRARRSVEKHTKLFKHSREHCLLHDLIYLLM